MNILNLKPFYRIQLQKEKFDELTGECLKHLNTSTPPELGLIREEVQDAGQFWELREVAAGVVGGATRHQTPV